MIHYPTIKLIYDRHKRASSTKEGAIELRITHQRQQRCGYGGCQQGAGTLDNEDNTADICQVA